MENAIGKIPETVPFARSRNSPRFFFGFCMTKNIWRVWNILIKANEYFHIPRHRQFTQIPNQNPRKWKPSYVFTFLYYFFFPKLWRYVWQKIIMCMLYRKWINYMWIQVLPVIRSQEKWKSIKNLKHDR